jgi:nucleotide-binding universal stress UspA family protein
MVVKKILVPFDISEYSLDASKEAIELAESVGASMIFIHIVEPDPYMDKFYDLPQDEEDVEDEITAKVKEWFSPVAEKISSKKINCIMEVLFDRVSTTETIVDYAKDIGADLIVIGHSSIHGFERRLKGDVAKEVIEHAHPPCSILVVKRP